MWPRFQRGHPLLLDGKTQNGAAGANAAGIATSRRSDRPLRGRRSTKAIMCEMRACRAIQDGRRRTQIFVLFDEAGADARRAQPR
jgi:hypothetical protein